MLSRAGRLIATLTFLLLVSATSATPSAGEGLTRATGGFQSQRGDAERRNPTTLKDFAAARALRGGNPADEPQQQKFSTCCGFRIYEAYTELFDDFDGDGYYTYLRLSFDVDTDYTEATVYADVFLISSAGEFIRIYESDLFTIFGASANDDYEVEAELVTGFPPDSYDVLIEIYDAYDDSLVVEYGPIDSSALSLLPMEDISFDDPYRGAHVHGGGGALSVPALLWLLAALVLHRAGGNRTNAPGNGG